MTRQGAIDTGQNAAIRRCNYCGEEFAPRNRRQMFCSYSCASKARPREKREQADRFWEKVDKNGPIPIGRPDLGPCWLWTACLSRGYGKFGIARGKPPLQAHRWAYEHLVGPIPVGLTLDHLCRNRRCVNPKHLEPVTSGENVLRGDGFAAQNARKTNCVNGHPFDESNTIIRKDGDRRCRICQKSAAARAEARRPPRRHCRVIETSA